jgi:glycosyltransferase involved in cell wall biosynthesis
MVLMDSISELQDYIKQLLTNDKLAKEISDMARKTALNLFDVQKIKPQWDTFFKSL